MSAAAATPSFCRVLRIACPFWVKPSLFWVVRARFGPKLSNKSITPGGAVATAPVPAIIGDQGVRTTAAELYDIFAEFFRPTDSFVLEFFVDPAAKLVNAAFVSLKSFAQVVFTSILLAAAVVGLPHLVRAFFRSRSAWKVIKACRWSLGWWRVLGHRAACPAWRGL